MKQGSFASFWMAGYECSDQLNCFGDRANLLESSGHLQLIDEDYKNLGNFNIKTVREGIRWSHVEKQPYQYDWSTVLVMFQKAKLYNIQQIWDICHFGYAADLTPLHPKFAQRFAALCRAFAILFKSHFPDQTLIVTPINEVSFISWLGGDVKGTTPYCHGQGWDVKYHLMKAYIEGVVAMKEIDANIKILATEPLINTVAPVGATAEMIQQSLDFNESQYQAIDILCGKICPELGGSSACLDYMGFNYYYNNQWTIDQHVFLSWKQQSKPEGWVSLANLLLNGHQRYGCPVIISETSHPGIDRPQWINYIGQECLAALQMGVPLLGVCLYPIIDRTDWDFMEIWHRSGLWDADDKSDLPPGRKLYLPYATALIKTQQQLEIGLKNYAAINKIKKSIKKIKYSNYPLA